MATGSADHAAVDGASVGSSPARLFALCLVLTVSACANNLAPLAEAPSGGLGRPDYVAGSDLRGIPGANLYEVLERVRPRWLLSSGSRMHSVRLRTEIAVIADGQYLGDVASLRLLPAVGVNQVRYLRGNEAAIGFAGFATDRHLEAAIVVDFSRTVNRD